MGTVGGKLLGADRERGRVVEFEESTGRYARSHCTVERFKVKVSPLRAFIAELFLATVGVYGDDHFRRTWRTTVTEYLLP